MLDELIELKFLEFLECCLGKWSMNVSYCYVIITILNKILSLSSLISK